jgi:sugar lactone lactonase YvrE
MTSVLRIGSTLWRATAMVALLTSLAALVTACGGSDDPTPAAAAFAPTITVQPAPATVDEGVAATFAVTAGGTAPLAYQWRRNGSDIAGANLATYTLPATTLADSGALFSVRVSNSAGSVTSSAAALTINVRLVPVTITAAPQSMTVAELQAVTVSIAASGTSPLTYQWQRSTDGATWTDIAGATNSSYTTTPLLRTDSGLQLRVIVNNAANQPATSAPAQLTVTPDAAVLLAAGGTVSGDNDNIRIEVPPGTLLGPTRFTFTPLAALPSLPADYELVPNTAYRIVHEGPGFVPNMPVSVIFRTAATAPVTAQAVRPLSTDSRVTRLALPPGTSGYQLCPDNTNGTLVPLEDIQQGNAKGALVMCGNVPASSPPSGNTTVGQVRPTPAVRPTITQQPVNIAVATPQPVTFSVVASGQAPLRYEWLRNGVTIPGATSASYTIDAPTASDNGARFSVIVANSFGSVASREASLTIGQAPLAGPTDIAFAASGDAFIADTFNGAIRKLSVAGEISTYAGRASLSGTSPPVASVILATPMGVVSDASGNVYVAEFTVHRIRKIAPDGLVTNFAGEGGVSGSADGVGTAARFTNPQGLAIDGAGNIYVADQGNQTIRKITPDGVVTTLAGLARTVGYADGTGSAARFTAPRGIAADAAGNVYVADGTHTIRAITSAGVVTTVAGLAGSPGSGDGAGAAAQFRDPPGIAVDAAGNLYVADQGNHTIRKIGAGVVTTIAGFAGTAGYADGNGSAARFNSPEGIAVDAAGNVYVADRGNNAIRKITPAGVVSTVF